MSPYRPRLLPGLALTCVLATGCEPPPVVPTADPSQHKQTSRIEGQVVVVDSQSRGNVVVLLYDARYPPPPLGTGRPVSFTVIPMEQIFGEADPAASGPFTAPFTFSLVAPGKYLLRGFIDADTCRTGAPPCHAPDFIPWYSVTNEPNALDVAGAAADSGTRSLRVVEILENPQGGPLTPVTGVTVSFSTQTGLVPLDRPAFWVDLAASDARFDRGLGMKLTLRPLQLQRTPIDLRTQAFILRYVDPSGGSSPAVWPRVVVRKMEERPGLTAAQKLGDENDLDRNGVLDDTGVDYSGDGVPDRVVLQAELESSVVETVTKSSGALVFLPSLGINVSAVALDARNPLAPIPLPTLPSGRYALTLVQFTGQTWRVPNDLAQVVQLTTDRAEMSQSFIIEVP